MPYDQSALALADATDAAWAIAWTRFYLKDTRESEVFTDTELHAHLLANAFTVDAVAYFRPHATAAELVRADPDRATSEWLLTAKAEFRSPTAIANAIRAAGTWVDDLIETTAGERPPSGRTLQPVW